MWQLLLDYHADFDGWLGVQLQLIYMMAASGLPVPPPNGLGPKPTF